MYKNKPYRICAICSAKLTDKQVKEHERLCARCKEEWKDHLTEEWLNFIIKHSEYEYNLALRDHNRVISIEKVRTI